MYAERSRCEFPVSRSDPDSGVRKAAPRSQNIGKGGIHFRKHTPYVVVILYGRSPPPCLLLSD